MKKNRTFVKSYVYKYKLKKNTFTIFLKNNNIFTIFFLFKFGYFSKKPLFLIVRLKIYMYVI